MKSLTSSKTIVITGACCSGKTTLSRMISTMLSLPVIHLDEVLPRRGGNHWTSEIDLRTLLLHLRGRHLIEGAQVLGLNSADLNDFLVFLIDAERDEVIRRLVRRGFHDNQGRLVKGHSQLSRINTEIDWQMKKIDEFSRRIPNLIHVQMPWERAVMQILDCI